MFLMDVGVTDRYFKDDLASLARLGDDTQITSDTQRPLTHDDQPKMLSQRSV